MQFSKLLPTICVVVGVCTWTFMAAQDDGRAPQFGPSRPLSRVRQNTGIEVPEADEIETDVTTEYQPAVRPRVRALRVSHRRPPQTYAPEVAAMMLGALSQPTLEVREDPPGGTVSATPFSSMVKTTTRQTIVQVKVGLNGTPAASVQNIVLYLAFTQSAKFPTPVPRIVPGDALQRDPSGTIVSFPYNFAEFVNEGPFNLTATLQSPTTPPEESAKSTPLNIEFVHYNLPSIQITSFDSVAKIPSSAADVSRKPITDAIPFTNRRTFSMGVHIDVPGDPAAAAEFAKSSIGIQLFNGGELLSEQGLAMSAAPSQTTSLDFQLPDRISGPTYLSVRYHVIDPANPQDNHFDSAPSAFAPSRLVVVDTTGPEIIDARLISANVLQVRFRDNDLSDSAVTTSNYKYAKTSTLITGMAGVKVPSGATVNGNQVQLIVDSLETDTYQLAPTADLKDLAGNSANPANVVAFNSFPDRERGVHVPFPDFVTRTDRDKSKVFNPGDKVETRVARLYYYRDAHRVAEIINRNVRSYNRAAVKVAEQDAERTRDKAEQLTGERQASERRAIFDAQKTRTIERNAQQKERELAAAQANKSRLEAQSREADRTIDDAQQLQTALNAVTPIVPPPAPVPAPDGTTPATPAAPALPAITPQQAAITARLKSAQDLKSNLTGDIEAVTGKITTLTTELGDLQNQATESRMNEFNSREKTATSEFDEDRAKASQYRKELAAASADPDTYVPADINSPDPVTQVSISVIGEGLIQLRGPIRGINTIREMISQIDAPVGQVKVGIHTVQINGEHGNRMETVASRIEASLKLGQNLTSQSLMLLRRAIQEVAAQRVEQTNGQFGEGHRQVDRDRRYLYSFFGRDFTDELYEMDSEFLRSENKLLGLHSMDTLSIAQSMFILALAKNDVRQEILLRFRHLVMCELPEAEWDHRRTTNLLPRKFNTLQEVILNANARYHFRNLYAFVNAQVSSSETLTPTQREFIRLAQIFKSQMVAEMEFKQRVMERGLLEDRSNSEDDLSVALRGPHANAIQLIGQTFNDAVAASTKLNERWDIAATPVLQGKELTEQIEFKINLIKKKSDEVFRFRRAQYGKDKNGDFESDNDIAKQADRYSALLHSSVEHNPSKDEIDKLRDLRKLVRDSISTLVTDSPILSTDLIKYIRLEATDFDTRWSIDKVKPLDATAFLAVTWALRTETNVAIDSIRVEAKDWETVHTKYLEFRSLLEDPGTPAAKLQEVYMPLTVALTRVLARIADKPDTTYYKSLKLLESTLREAYAAVRAREVKINAAQAIEKRTRGSLDHRKIMDFHIDEQAEKVVELAEGTRSHIAQMDNYLKRMYIALEDDFQAQFYDPAFEDVRRASRMWDVNLGQIERTTLLGNNRTLMKVSPQATMEFDLPKRHTAIFEGMAVAKAAYSEYGALVTDPNFLGLSKLASGSPAVGGDPRFAGQGGAYRDTMQNPSVKNVLPGMGSSPDEQMFTQVAGNKTQFGAALEGLIPDPAVYKFETGTGFEIRPVMQPDGSSLVFDFDYMYTTNVREPIRADEKHLGRVKRHFIHTQVQTTSFELREISRYLVALKASRTSRGVPLLEDVPGIGGLFRPLPSAESSLQQNIILSQSMAYPTLFDLMGLRWSKHLVDLDHAGLRDSEHVVRGRYKTVRDFTFDESSKNFDEFLDIEQKQPDHFRKDLYHKNSYPSPYHPGGYHAPGIPDESDPTGRRYNIPDNRPPEMQDPYYDPKYRRPLDSEPVGPGQPLVPQAVGPGEQLDRQPVGPGEPMNNGRATQYPSPTGATRRRAPSRAVPASETPDDNQGPVFRGDQNMPTSQRRSRSGNAAPVASGRVPSKSVTWVADEHASTTGRAKVSGYKELEPKFLTPPKSNNRLPSIKQFFSGSKAEAAQNTWMGIKAK
jgi:hypothetical protein